MTSFRLNADQNGVSLLRTSIVCKNCYETGRNTGVEEVRLGQKSDIKSDPVENGPTVSVVMTCETDQRGRN